MNTIRIANIAKQHNKEKTAVLQETPLGTGKPHACRTLKMTKTDSNSNIIEGVGKEKSLGKKGNRCYDKCTANKSAETVVNEGNKKKKVVERLEKEKIAATGKGNVTQPKRSCDVATSDAVKSTLPVISKGVNNATKKVMPPFSEPGTSSMQEISKRKKEDPFEFNESEEDVRKCTKKQKTKSLPVPEKVKERIFPQQNKTKSVGAKEQVTTRQEKTQNKNRRTVAQSTYGSLNDKKKEETATGVAFSERRKEALSEMAAEFKIFAKKMTRFAKRFANLCEVESSDESDFEIVGLEDENDDEIEVAPNWKLPRETVAKAGLSNTMNNRLGILVRSLWGEETRKELTTKKDGKGEAGKKRVSNEEAKLIMNVCYNLQAYRKLPLNEVKTVEDTMQAIGKKLAYDRYNAMRYQKQRMSKQTHVNEGSLQENESDRDYDGSNSDDEEEENDSN